MKKSNRLLRTLVIGFGALILIAAIIFRIFIPTETALDFFDGFGQSNSIVVNDKKIVLHPNQEYSQNIVNGKTFSINTYGKTKIHLMGKVNFLRINAHGKSKIDAKDLIAETVVIKSYGKSEIVVHAEKSLHVEAFGKSMISYYGNPTVTQNLFGNVQLIKK